MTPVWIFPCYRRSNPILTKLEHGTPGSWLTFEIALLVIGPHAAALSEKLGPWPTRGLDIIIGGFVFQGIGFLLSLMIYAAFIYRLMTQKLPNENLRPGMFVSVGPSGFTISGIVGMGLNLPDLAPDDFLIADHGVLAAQVSQIVSIWIGLWLWGLALWFFLVSVGAHWSCIRKRSMTFAMTFYSYVFPNTALTSATFSLAKALDNRPIRVLGCTMTILLIMAWLAVFIMMIRAVIAKDILWPQKQEDRAEGGWSKHSEEQVVCDVRYCSDNEDPGRLDSAVPSIGIMQADAQHASRPATANGILPDSPHVWANQTHLSRQRTNMGGADGIV